ncbi:unnamed protein product [Phytomonas sp. EM1]|nr:unnamed protein product [Phytomonas sp. EM1]|eukprot:CCW59630.1 unnamed protein product [Phytomonas sp. isolate EM1]
MPMLTGDMLFHTAAPWSGTRPEKFVNNAQDPPQSCEFLHSPVQRMDPNVGVLPNSFQAGMPMGMPNFPLETMPYPNQIPWPMGTAVAPVDQGSLLIPQHRCALVSPFLPFNGRAYAFVLPSPCGGNPTCGGGEFLGGAPPVVSPDFVNSGGYVPNPCGAHTPVSGKQPSSFGDTGDPHSCAPSSGCAFHRHLLSLLRDCLRECDGTQQRGEGGGAVSGESSVGAAVKLAQDLKLPGVVWRNDPYSTRVFEMTEVVGERDLTKDNEGGDCANAPPPIQTPHYGVEDVHAKQTGFEPCRYPPAECNQAYSTPPHAVERPPSYIGGVSTRRAFISALEREVAGYSASVVSDITASLRAHQPQSEPTVGGVALKGSTVAPATIKGFPVPLPSMSDSVDNSHRSNQAPTHDRSSSRSPAPSKRRYVAPGTAVVIQHTTEKTSVATQFLSFRPSSFGSVPTDNTGHRGPEKPGAALDSRSQSPILITGLHDIPATPLADEPAPLPPALPLLSEVSSASTAEARKDGSRRSPPQTEKRTDDPPLPSQQQQPALSAPPPITPVKFRRSFAKTRRTLHRQLLPYAPFISPSVTALGTPTPGQEEKGPVGPVSPPLPLGLVPPPPAPAEFALLQRRLTQLFSRLRHAGCFEDVLANRGRRVNALQRGQGGVRPYSEAQRRGAMVPNAESSYIYVLQHHHRRSACTSDRFFPVGTLVAVDGDMGAESGVVQLVVGKAEFDELTAQERRVRGLPARLHTAQQFLLYRASTDEEKVVYTTLLAELNQSTLWFLSALRHHHSFEACRIDLMSFTGCEFQADGQKLYVYYESSEPIRFLELATYLHHIFHCRIWIEEMSIRCKKMGLKTITSGCATQGGKKGTIL